jgi:hypothetical protein
LDEEGPYLSWVTRHRDGFVIDWLRKPTRRHPIVHRSTCKKIKVAKSKKTHWTTGRRLKACSADLQQLAKWAEQESGQEISYCDECQPQTKTRSHRPVDPGQLTKLQKEIMDYVLEIAVIHLDNPEQTYELTVGNVAECLNKTTGQITGALLRLIQGSLLRLDQTVVGKADIRSPLRVFPTSQALKKEPAFKKLSEREIKAELAGLDRKA